MISLQTERLLIRDHIAADLPSHHALMSDKDVMYYLQDIAAGDMAESEANLRDAIAEANSPDRKRYFFRVENRLTAEHIGEIGYTVIFSAPVGKNAEVGYFIRREHWGKGYTAEAFKEVLRFAFEEDGVYRISCGCIKDNTGSERVMIKCGLIKEADYKHYVWHDGRLKDRVEYRLLRDEWHHFTLTTTASSSLAVREKDGER